MTEFFDYILDMVGPSPLFRIRDLPRQGLTLGRLRTLIRRGTVHRVARGLYQWSDQPFDENVTIAYVAAVVPGGIVCLLTALRYHGIGTQEPSEVWIAVNRKAHLPKAGGLPVRVVRFSGSCRACGVDTITLDGTTVRITNPARSIVDAFRYRNQVGIDVAVEALREGLRLGKATRGEIRHVAHVCHAKTIIEPYLQAMS